MSIEQRDRNRLILFGICDDLKTFVWDNRREIILAIIDLKTENQHKIFNYRVGKETIFNGLVSSVDEICKMNFDYIIVTDYSILEKAYVTLKDKGIPEQRVILYDYYVQCIRAHTYYSTQEEALFLQLFHILNAHNVIDLDLFFTDKYRFSREYAEMSFPQNMQVDAYSPSIELLPIYNNVYRNVYRNFREFSLKTYDVAIFSDYRSFQGYIEAFDFAKDIADNIILRFRPNSTAFQQFLKVDFSIWGVVKQFNFVNSWIILLSKIRSNDMKIYIVTHKPFNVPVPYKHEGGGLECLSTHTSWEKGQPSFKISWR